MKPDTLAGFIWLWMRGGVILGYEKEEDQSLRREDDRRRKIQKGKKKKTRLERGGGAEVALFPFRESNQIPLIAHYLKRLSGTVMRLHGGPRLRDFLVYRCWRVLELTGRASAEGKEEGWRGDKEKEEDSVGINTWCMSENSFRATTRRENVVCALTYKETDVQGQKKKKPAWTFAHFVIPFRKRICNMLYMCQLINLALVLLLCLKPVYMLRPH